MFALRRLVALSICFVVALGCSAGPASAGTNHKRGAKQHKRGAKQHKHGAKKHKHAAKQHKHGAKKGRIAAVKKPAVPTGLTATAGDAAITLNWKAVSTTPLSGYKVYRRNSNGTWPTTARAKTSATNWKDTGLANGTSYAYRVTAYNSAGQSGASNVASATPVAPQPAPSPAPAPGCPTSGPYAAAVAATAGLVGFWRLGDSTSSACDSTGSNSGTYAGGYSLGWAGAVSGDSNAAAGFDGATGSVSVPDSSTLRFGDTFSVEAWARRGSVGRAQVIASKQSGSWVLMFNSGDQLVLRRATVGDVVASTTVVTDTSTWHHVAATKSGSSVHLYVDGREVTGTVTNDTMVDNTSPLVIGKSSETAFFNGTLDEVAVYRTALSAAQIANHQQAGTGSSHDPVIGTAGDIACDPTNPAFNGGVGTALACRQGSTASLLLARPLDAVLTLGDTQYVDATLQQFQASYDPSWGQLKSITRPVTGNHEYYTPEASGYFDYFNGIGAANGPAGDRSRGYYSYDIGTWHMIALNSECVQVNGCERGSDQERWLAGDLASHTNACVLAYWHKPLFNSGYSGEATEMRDIWRTLYDAGADVVLNGHSHSYERFAPQTADGAPDPARGIREFVVGTGGTSLHALGTLAANSQVLDFNNFGIMRMTLHPAGYDWEFVPEAGKTFTDSGSASCH